MEEWFDVISPLSIMDTSSQNPYWSRPTEDLFAQLQSSAEGLSSGLAQQHLETFGYNLLRDREKATPFRLFLNQFKSPLVLILVFAAAISILTGEWIDATIVILIVVASAILGFIQEYSASNAVEKLRNQIKLKSAVLRDGKPASIPVEDVVPGDVVLLSAGSLIPAGGGGARPACQKGPIASSWGRTCAVGLPVY